MQREVSRTAFGPAIRVRGQSRSFPGFSTHPVGGKSLACDGAAGKCASGNAKRDNMVKKHSERTHMQASRTLTAVDIQPAVLMATSEGDRAAADDAGVVSVGLWLFYLWTDFRRHVISPSPTTAFLIV